MGQWEKHCQQCSPSENLESVFKNVMACTSDKWYFETIDEDGHNGNLRSPTEWFVGIYTKDTVAKTILMLSIAKDVDKKKEVFIYKVRVKVDHNRCPFDWRSHKKEHQYPWQLDQIREDFMLEWGQKEPFNTMKTWNKAGGESVTILAKHFQSFDEATDLLLEITDALDG